MHTLQVEAGYTFSPLMARYTGNGHSAECLVTQVRRRKLVITYF